MYSTELQGKPAALTSREHLGVRLLCLYNIIHRPEEALDIQSELIFVNGMVHLPHV